MRRLAGGARSMRVGVPVVRCARRKLAPASTRRPMMPRIQLRPGGIGLGGRTQVREPSGSWAQSAIMAR